MKNNRTDYTLLGGFVLAALATLLTSLYLLGGTRGPTHIYYTELSNVAGVTFGTPVTYAGYPVGQVDSVTPQQTGHGTRYRVALAIREDWRIPDDSIARAMADGLLSAVSIDIEEGASRTALAPQERLRGIAAGNVFGAMNAVAGEIESLSRETVRPMLARLHRSVDVLAAAVEGSAPALLTDLGTVSQHLGEELPASLAQLHALSARLNRQVPDILDDIQATSAALRANTPQVAATVQSSVARVDTLLSERNLRHVESMLANLDHASADIGQLVGRLDATAGSVDALLTDVDTLIESTSPEIGATLAEVRTALQRVSGTVETVSHHLEGSSRNMHEFSRRIRDNPSALLLSTAPHQVSPP